MPPAPLLGQQQQGGGLPSSTSSFENNSRSLEDPPSPKLETKRPRRWKASDYLRSPLVLVQIVNAAYLIVAVNQPELYAAVIVGSVVYYLLVVTDQDRKRLYWQRDFCEYIREFFAKQLNLVKIRDIRKDEWDALNGIKTFSTVFSAVGVPLGVTFLFEGKYFNAFSVALHFSYMVLAAKSDSREVMLFTGRFNVILHLSLASISGAGFGIESARRMMMVRTLLSLAYFESIFELAFQIVVFPTMYLSYRFGLDSGIIWLPLSYFIITVVPTEIFGIRPWFLRNRHQTINVSPSYHVALVMMLVPIAVSITTFSWGNESVSLPPGSSVMQDFEERMNNRNAAIPQLLISKFPYFGFSFCATWPWWGEYMDDFITKMAYKDMAKNVYTRNYELSAIWGTKVDVAFAAWVTALLIIVIYWELAPMLVLGILMLSVARCFTDNEIQRVALMVFHMCLVAYAPRTIDENFHNLITCSRLWHCFETRPLSETVSEMFFIFSYHGLFVGIWPKKVLVGVYVFGATVALALRLASENLTRFVQMAKAADSFLDHAIKQRLAALGTVIHHIIESSSDRLDWAMVETLSRAVLECQVGLAACHLSSAAIRFKSGAFPHAFERKPASVVHMLRSFSESGDFFVAIPIEGDESIEANVDWDLLRSLLVDMMQQTAFANLNLLDRVKRQEAYGQGLKNFSVWLSVTRSSRKSFKITLESKQKQSRGRRQDLLRGIRDSVAKALGGILGLDGKSIELPLVMSDVAGGMTSPEASTRSLSSEPSSLLSSSPIISPMTHLRPMTPMTFDRLPSDRTGKSAFQSPMSMIRSLSMQPEALNASESKLLNSLEKKRSSGSMFLRKDLSIAALDDNNLVRKSLVVMMRLHLSADMDKSFVMGATREEALSFPQIIVDRNVDIALFDENLEYEGETLKGSALAKVALQLGFKGCMVLHSANSALADQLDPCFHGFVEKTSSRDQFLRALGYVYDRYLAHHEKREGTN